MPLRSIGTSNSSLRLGAGRGLPHRGGLLGCDKHRHASAGPRSLARFQRSTRRRPRARLHDTAAQLATASNDAAAKGIEDASPTTWRAASWLNPKRSAASRSRLTVAKPFEFASMIMPPAPANGSSRRRRSGFASYEVHEQPGVYHRECAMLERTAAAAIAGNRAHHAIVALQQKGAPVGSVGSQTLIGFLVDADQRDVPPLPSRDDRLGAWLADSRSTSPGGVTSSTASVYPSPERRRESGLEVGLRKTHPGDAGLVRERPACAATRVEAAKYGEHLGERGLARLAPRGSQSQHESHAPQVGQNRRDCYLAVLAHREGQRVFTPIRRLRRLQRVVGDQPGDREILRDLREDLVQVTGRSRG